MRPHLIPAIAVIGMIGLLGATAPVARAQTTSIRDYTVEKKDEAVAYAKKATADLEAKIKELEAQASKQTGELKAKSQAQIKDLKIKQAKASEKATELSRATAKSWDKAKEGFANAYRDLAVAYDKAVAEFKK